MRDRKLPSYGWLIQAAVLALLLVATTVPGGDRSPAPQLCFLCGERATADFLLNVLLFMPLGMVQAWRGKTLLRALLVGAGLSLSIEVAQTAIPGRFPAVDDLVSNTLGAVAGWLAWRYVPALLDAEPARRMRLAWLAAGFAVLCQLAGVALAQPSLTRDVWFGQWTPQLGDLPLYPGRVREARVGSTPVLSHRLANSAMIRDSLVGGAPLVVRFEHEPPRERSIIFSIADAHHRMNVVLLGVRSSLRVHVRTIAERLGLSAVEIELEHALRDVTPGSEAQVGLRRDRGSWCVQTPGRMQCIGPNPAVLWREIAPRVEHGAIAVDVLFFVVLLLPVGYWAGLRGWPVATLAIVPTVALPFSHLGIVFSPFPVLGGIAGFILGALLGVARTRHSLRLGTITA